MLMVPQIDKIEPRPGVSYFVMLAEPNRELTAQANLFMRRVPHFLPTIFRAGRLPARLQGQKDAQHERPDVAMPLFPRMIFIAEDVVESMLHLIRSAPGMCSNPFLKFGEEFARLRPLGIETVRAIEGTEREKYFARKRKAGAPAWLPEIGAEVRFLLDEVLAGVEGKVSEVDEKGRITILTEIMKRTVRVHVTANQIEPV
jgi:transcription antitermination factor NusG